MTKEQRPVTRLRMNRRRGGLLLAAATALVLVACAGGQGGGDAGVQAVGDRASATPDAASGTITVTAERMQFDTDRIAFPAGQPVTIRFTNQDAAAHNIAIYRDSSTAEEIFVGQAISGPEETVLYQLTGLDAGTYYFHCDLHPNMNGEVLVEA